MTRGLMLYDADCGFCTRTARLVPRLRADVDLAALQETDLPAHGVDAVRARGEMPFVRVDGSVVYGHRAWAAVLESCPAPLRAAGRLLGSRMLGPVAARCYSWVARNRARLPGGTPACDLERRPSQRPR